MAEFYFNNLCLWRLTSQVCLRGDFESVLIMRRNRPFPSSCLPLLQSESKCDVFVMVISSTLHMNEN